MSAQENFKDLTVACQGLIHDWEAKAKRSEKQGHGDLAWGRQASATDLQYVLMVFGAQEEVDDESTVG